MSHRSQRIVAIGLALTGGLSYHLLRPVPVSSQATPDLTAQFRIWVGMKDTTPKEWRGNITLAGAELAGLLGVRFSGEDRASKDGSFQFRTKVGNLENQLHTAHPYGATDWDDPSAQRLIPEGLIVQARGSAAVRIAFDSPAGSFTVDTANLLFGERVSALDGNVW